MRMKKRPFPRSALVRRAGTLASELESRRFRLPSLAVRNDRARRPRRTSPMSDLVRQAGTPASEWESRRFPLPSL